MDHVPEAEPQTSNALLDELKWRGLVAQTTDEEALASALSEGPLRLYCGFDPTAASLDTVP